MAGTRKIAAILVADIVGYSRLAGADEDRTLSRLRGLRSDLIDPAIEAHHGRIVKRTGDGSLIEFRSVVDAVRCAIEVQNGMAERNAGLPPERRIQFRVGIHLGDVVEESDGDLMGDGVNIAARLESICQPGAICLSEDAYRQVKGRLDLAVSDLGPKELKNIAEPVRVFSLEVGKPVQAKPASGAKPPEKPHEPKKRSRLALLGTAILALIVIAAGAWYFIKTNPVATVVSNAPAPPHLSIAVLPFKNLSNDPSQDSFVDSLTDTLTSDLSRIRNSFVIARSTSFTFKDKNHDAKEIGKALNVRYLLEGSVLRDQNRVRVNAQLIDAQSGAHLWADRFEENVTDSFELQDRILARLAEALRQQLVVAEAETGALSKNPDTIDLTMRGRSMMLGPQRPTREKNDAAIALLEQALKINPDESDALANLALAYARSTAWRWNPGSDYPAKILNLANRAIEIDPNNVAAYIAQTYAFGFDGRWQEVIRAATAGLALNPTSAALYMARSTAEGQVDRYDEFVSDRERATHFNSHDQDVAWLSLPPMGGRLLSGSPK